MGYKISQNKIRPDPDRLQPLISMPAPRSSDELKRATGLFAYYAKWIEGFSEKVRPIIKSSTFPLSQEAVEAFNYLKSALINASLACIQENVDFTVECDASQTTIAAVLSQGGRPVAYMSKTLSGAEKKYPAVEKEALAIMNAIRRWDHLLLGKHFTLVTDQKAFSYMFNPQAKGKIKSQKFQLWRSELGSFKYSIVHKPGSLNIGADSNQFYFHRAIIFGKNS